MSLIIDELIKEVRLETENEDVTDTTGIKDKEFVRYLNDAQDRIHSLIVKQHNKIFLVEKEIDAIKGTYEYSLPKDIHMSNMVAAVEYSDTRDEDDYYELESAPLSYRTSEEGSPSYYIRKNGKILLSPAPNEAGKIRISYIRKPRRLAKRAASIASVTTSGSSITSLFLDVSTNTIDSEALSRYNYFTVVDRDGEVLMSGVEFDAINTTTGEVTITSGFEFESGETIPVGAYIVPGKYSSTHTALPESVERYLKAYCAWKIMKRDSSVDYSEQQEELLAMESEIVDAYADISDDIHRIPEINEDDWWD